MSLHEVCPGEPAPPKENDPVGPVLRSVAALRGGRRRRQRGQLWGTEPDEATL